MTPAEHWALWHADPRATPFQSPAWLAAWWTHFGGGERLDAEVRGPGDQLVAALPLFVWHDGPIHRLVPLGAGQSDYADALLAPGTDPALLWAAMLTPADRFDEVLLPDLRTDSALLGPVPSGWQAFDEPGETCPVLAIPADGAVLASLTKTQRRKIVHDRHRAHRLGDVEEALATTPEAVDEALAALFALHAARWARAGEAGVLADPRMQAMLRDAAAGLAGAGLLRLATVRHGGRLVAVLYGFADGARGHSYINGVDMSVPAQSFGTLAFACLIERAVADGAAEFHFLRGEEPYKYAWGATPRHTVRRTVRRA